MTQRYNTDNPVPSNAMMDLNDNAIVFDEFVNNPSGNTITRKGVIVPVLQEQVKNRIDGLMEDAIDAVSSAQHSALSAQASAADAQAIADGGTTFATTAEGIAATTSGQYFRVPQGTGSEISFIYYLNNAGVALAVAQQVGSAALSARFDLTTSNNISNIKDSTGLSTLVQDELGEIYIPGIQDSLQEGLNRTASTRTQSIFVVKDEHGAGLQVQDELGRTYLPGMKKSVQETLDEASERVKSSRSPFLNLMPDSQKAVWQRVDEMGSIHLPGIPSSLQMQLNHNTERLSEMARNRQVYNAREFGLRKEQGARNEYIINGAIDTAARNGGGIVFVPPGNWGLMGAIAPRSGVSIIGAGQGATILRPRSSFAAILRLPTDDSYLTDCVFQDFAIDGSEQTLVGDSTYDSRIKGFYFFFFKRCFFHRLLIQNTGATGLGVDYAYDCTMTSITTENCGRLAPAGQAGASGIGIGTGGSLDEPLYIGGTFNRNNKNFGIFGEWARRDNSTNHSRYSIYANNVCTGNGKAGIGDCGLDGLICTGNDLTNNLGYGFLQDTGTMDVIGGRPAPGSRGILLGNNISRNGKSGIGYDGTAVAGSGYHYKHNIVNDNAEFGIEIISPAREYNDVWVFGNEIARNGRDGFRLSSGTMRNLDIEHNRIFNNGQNQSSGGGSGIVLNGNVSVGSITSNKLRDTQATKTQDYGLCGSGSLTDVDIDGNHYSGFITAAENLTGTKTNVTYGRNPGKN